MRKLVLLLFAALTACTSPSANKDAAQSAVCINEVARKAAIDSIKASHPDINADLLEKGVKHAASLWRKEDGTPEEFITFTNHNYVTDPAVGKLSSGRSAFTWNRCIGNFNEITLDLKKILDESAGKIDEIDRMFGNYSVYSHLQEDFYTNKIAFLIALNFPYFTLEEKEKLGPGWSREEWAMARLGDSFISRVPADLNQALSTATGNAEMYIAEYNINMGKLRTDDNRQIFPDGMVLLSHWNLRDELKADYADRQNGPEKQEMIYKVMQRIINQEIPEIVINNPDYEWAALFKQSHQRNPAH